MAANAESLPHTGLGLLGFTWRPKKVSDEQAFAAMKAAVNSGAVIWSSSSVYGGLPDPLTTGLQLLRRYFEKHPEDATVCPIKFAEVEFPLWSTEMLDNGVAEAARDRDVAILSYAPLGYGFLSGSVRTFPRVTQAAALVASSQM